VNLAQQRKAQARALSASIDQLVALSQPLADQQGIDLQALLDQAEARSAEEQQQLAERLQESVLPLFVHDDRGCPSLLGSCVLVRLDSDYYAFTAAHVLRDAGSAQLWAPPRGKGEKLLRLQWSAAYLTPAAVSHDLDVGVLALPASALGAFEQRVFLNGLGVDEDDQPDDGGLTSFYFVLGYPASRTQVKVSHQTRLINVKSFSSTTSAVAAGEYLQESLLQSDYLLLNFDHKDIAIQGVRVSPPRLKGVSGGGIFHLSRSSSQGPLVAIATENRRNSRLIVGTRLKHFLMAARQLRATSPPEFFE
jgi:hypothetical protein